MKTSISRKVGVYKASRSHNQDGLHVHVWVKPYNNLEKPVDRFYEFLHESLKTYKYYNEPRIYMYVMTMTYFYS